MLGVLCSLFAAAAQGQVPAAELAKPPANARHYVIQSTGGKHGDSYSWISADGSRMARESMNLRGQVWEVDYSGKSGADGMPATLTVRGVTPQGDAAEHFEVLGDRAHWKSPVDSGSSPYATPGFYATMGGPIDTNAWLLERLLASPNHSMALLPGGSAHADKLATLEIHGRAPGDTRKIDLWAVTGLNNSPVPIWADQDGKFFGLTFGLAFLPEAYAGEQAKMEQAQSAAQAAATAQLAKTLVTMPKGAVAFTHVRLYDALDMRFLDDETVVVDQGRIAAVGPSGDVKVPANAQQIDGRGKTLIPGLWDCHMHVGDDYTGVQELSLGVTSVRDPGNDDIRTMDRRTRTAAGELLFPHVYPSSLIDGKGPYTAQVANVATSQAEAIALVDRAKANGFTGIKFYGTFNPAWLPASIAEAHKLGLHVHGHIPAGIRPLDAVNDGYDEITHINWIIMQALPDSVIKVSNGIARFEGPGRYAKDVNLDGPPMSDLLQAMVAKHIYSDPTMVAFESLYVPENGDLSPSYAPFVGTLPPTVERGFKVGGFAVPKDLTRADYRASWAKMVALLKKMHEAGIPIVAGTDGSGIEIVRELEVYQQAGFTPAQALAAGTIVPARLVGADAHTGSITVGKNADLALVDGDPAKDLASLRQTRVVMLDGKLLDADALRSAAGFSGRPR
jgi:imidazolonepropionase-like amidohydrolase